MLNTFTLLQVSNIYWEFQSETTSISIEYKLHEHLPLPGISFCPAKATKQSLNKITATREEFEQVLFQRTELVLESKSNDSVWDYTGSVKSKKKVQQGRHRLPFNP